MTNFTAGIFDIINDPMSQGFGAGLGQRMTTSNQTKTVSSNTANGSNTIASVLTSVLTGKTNTTPQVNSASVQPVTSSSTQTQMTTGGIIRTDTQEKNDTDLVTLLLKSSVDAILQDQINKGKISLNQKDSAAAYLTVYSYYEKLFNGSIITDAFRNKAEKNISGTIDKTVTDKLTAGRTSILPEQKEVLQKSKLAEALKETAITEAVKYLTTGSSDITGAQIWSTVLTSGLDNIQKTAEKQIEDTSKVDIASILKQRETTAETVKVFKEKKQLQEQALAQLVSSLQSQVMIQIENLTKELVTSLGDSVKALTSGVQIRTDNLKMETPGITKL